MTADRPERAPEGLSAEERALLQRAMPRDVNHKRVDSQRIEQAIERIIAARATASAEEVERASSFGEEVLRDRARRAESGARRAEAEVERLRADLALNVELEVALKQVRALLRYEYVSRLDLYAALTEVDQ